MKKRAVIYLAICVFLISFAGRAAAQPLLTKTFLSTPVMPGDTVTLEFTISLPEGDPAVTGIAFTDDLGAVIPGLVAAGLPLNNVCGPGSLISGTSVLTFTGGSLAEGGTCTFSVTLQVPSNASPGVHTNTTSALTALAGGDPVQSNPAVALLEVTTLSLSKSFIPAVVPPGGNVTLEFTVGNTSTSSTAAGITFADDLSAVLPGLVAVGLPLNDVCGAGSQISGTSLLTFVGGSLPPAASCTFSVTLQVPAGASLGTSGTNTTTPVAGLVGGVPVTGNPASAVLSVDITPGFGKAFTPGTIVAGRTSTLTFTIDNTAAIHTANALSFTDNLPAGTAIANPANASTTCTGGTLTALSGGNVITYTGGTLAAGNQCTVSVDVTGVTAGTHINTTGNLTSDLGNSGMASDTLVVEPLPVFTKGFSPSLIIAGGTSTLTFTIDNTGSSFSAASVAFTDNLPAGMLVANPANASTTCAGGTLTADAGSGLISYSGGTLAAGAACTISVNVTAAAPGTYTNTTGDLTSDLGNSGPASAALAVDPLPVFSKGFTPAVIVSGGTSTLTFTIDNTGSSFSAASVAFTDNLPAGMLVANPANASTTCAGGTLTADAGSGLISYSGGTLAAGAACTISVDVTAAAPGTYTNITGDLTSDLGNSGPATGALQIPTPVPALDERGMVIFMVAAGLVSIFTLRKRRHKAGN